MSTWEECRKIHELFPSSPDPDQDPVAFLIYLRHAIAELKDKIQALEREAKKGDEIEQAYAEEIKDLKDEILWLSKTSLREFARARRETTKELEEELDASRAKENTWKDKYLELQIILVERDQKIAWLREQIQNLLRPEAPRPAYKYKASGERHRIQSGSGQVSPNPGFLSKKAFDHLVKQLVNHKLKIKHLVDQIEEEHGKTVLFSARTLYSIEEAKKLLEAP